MKRVEGKKTLNKVKETAERVKGKEEECKEEGKGGESGRKGKRRESGGEEKGKCGGEWKIKRKRY